MELFSHSYQWASGDAYGHGDGRWGRELAHSFVQWLDAPAQGTWVDLGCGTGNLTRAILEGGSPREVLGIDLSDGFLEFARANITDRRAAFHAGDVCAIAMPDSSAECVAGGLVVNFVRSPPRMLREAYRVLGAGGILGLYVWDYRAAMQPLDVFWRAAAAADPSACTYDDRTLHALWQPAHLRASLAVAGFRDVQVRGFDVDIVFRDIEEYWTCMRLAPGAPSSYIATRSERQRAQLRENLRLLLALERSAPLRLAARAWAVRGAR